MLMSTCGSHYMWLFSTAVHVLTSIKQVRAASCTGVAMQHMSHLQAEQAAASTLAPGLWPHKGVHVFAQLPLAAGLPHVH